MTGIRKDILNALLNAYAPLRAVRDQNIDDLGDNMLFNEVLYDIMGKIERSAQYLLDLDDMATKDDDLVMDFIDSMFDEGGKPYLILYTTRTADEVIELCKQFKEDHKEINA